MNSEQAFEFVNKLFWEKAKTSLSQCQKDVVIGIWQGKTYQEISDETNWAYQTIKETASELFKKISKLLELKVNEPLATVNLRPQTEVWGYTNKTCLRRFQSQFALSPRRRTWFV